MTETQSKIRQTISKKFQRFIKDKSWSHSSASKIAQISRVTLRSSLFTFQHQFRTLLQKRQEEIVIRKKDWENACMLGLKFETLKTESEHLLEKIDQVRI